MSAFTLRDPTRSEQMAAAWEAFVDGLVDGYSMGIYEYTNDLHCRVYLEEHRTDEDVLAMWPRVENADERAKAILLPAKGCLHGDHPRSWFWYWTYPASSPELEADLRRIDLI